jgi:hypothetical protein
VFLSKFLVVFANWVNGMIDELLIEVPGETWLELNILLHFYVILSFWIHFDANVFVLACISCFDCNTFTLELLI